MAISTAAATPPRTSSCAMRPTGPGRRPRRSTSWATPSTTRRGCWSTATTPTTRSWAGSPTRARGRREVRVHLRDRGHASQRGCRFDRQPARGLPGRLLRPDHLRRYEHHRRLLDRRHHLGSGRASRAASGRRQGGHVRLQQRGGDVARGRVRELRADERHGRRAVAAISSTAPPWTPAAGTRSSTTTRRPTRFPAARFGSRPSPATSTPATRSRRRTTSSSSRPITRRPTGPSRPRCSAARSTAATRRAG